MNCEFCDELNPIADTRFRAIYAGLLDSRIALKDADYVAFPTIGQLFEGSYLVVPTVHVEKFAQLSPDLRSNALRFVSRIESELRIASPTLVYEHGATSSIGGGCGIYHAHLHVVPLPEATSLEILLPGVLGTQPRTILEGWNQVEGASEYLLVQDTRGKVLVARQNAAGEPFGSQYMRRRLVELFQLQAPWDWRDYTLPEAKLLRTAQILPPSRASHGMDNRH